MKDDFGDRMKCYENKMRTFITHNDDEEIIFPYLRLDGRSFSSFTKKLASKGTIVKPRDQQFESVFVEATKDTVEEFNLALGFHQSDEISLFFNPLVKGDKTELPFNGNLQKIISVFASYFTARWIYHFNAVYGYVPEVSFDCRAVVFPEQFEAVNMLVWRWQDATRNVIQDYAHNLFSNKLLDRKSTREKLEMVKEKVPDFEKDVLVTFGNFVKRETYVKETPLIAETDSVIRSRVVKQDIDFKSLSFEDRTNLVYGKIHKI